MLFYCPMCSCRWAGDDHTVFCPSCGNDVIFLLMPWIIGAVAPKQPATNVTNWKADYLENKN